jgi:hypothetical protein
MSDSPHKVIPVKMTAKDMRMLDRFMKEEAGRMLDMRIPSSRLIWQILTQINLRGKKQ